jgi:hypothetical protein
MPYGAPITSTRPSSHLRALRSCSAQWLLTRWFARRSVQPVRGEHAFIDTPMGVSRVSCRSVGFCWRTFMIRPQHTSNSFFFAKRLCFLMWVGLLLLSACASGISTGSDGGSIDAIAPVPSVPRLCTPGNNVYCQCPNGQEGTKLCNDTGMGYSACRRDVDMECPALDGG